jgi:hypothetical protein
MKKQLTDRKRKILRRIYGALSLTSALFIFQACYGPMQDFGNVIIQGFVKSKTTELPIPGIKVTVNNEPQYEVTSSSGTFKIYTTVSSEYRMIFEDVDSISNGSYLRKDTTLKNVNSFNWLNVSLNDK